MSYYLIIFLNLFNLIALYFYNNPTFWLISTFMVNFWLSTCVLILLSDLTRTFLVGCFKYVYTAGFVYIYIYMCVYLYKDIDT